MTDYVIECQECATGDRAHRDDCLVALFEDIEATSQAPMLFDESEVRALHALQLGGLIPRSVTMPKPVDPPMRGTGS